MTATQTKRGGVVQPPPLHKSLVTKRVRQRVLLPGGEGLEEARLIADIDILAGRRVRAPTLVVLADAASTGTEDEQVSIVLSVESTLHVNRHGCVGGADGQIGEDLVLRRGENVPPAVALAKDVDIAVFTFDVDIAGPVDGRSVDAPLESVRMITYTTTRTVGIPMAAKCLSAH